MWPLDEFSYNSTHGQIATHVENVLSIALPNFGIKYAIPVWIARRQDTWTTNFLILVCCD
jgi:hypothetical protein